MGIVAKRNRGPSDTVRYRVYARDGYRCRICGLPTIPCYRPRGKRSARFRATWRHMSDWFPTLDHIVLWSISHDNNDVNLRTTHKWCNHRRSNDLRTDAEVRSLAHSRWRMMSGGHL